MSASDLNGDLLRADEKIREGLKWDDTMSIPVAGEQMEFGFTLLDERILQRVQNELPLDELQAYRTEDRSEEYERFMELQKKGPDEMTEAEREEFLELADEVDPEQEGRDSLSEEGVDALMDAGKHALEPTDDDVSDIISADPETQERVFDGDIPDHIDSETARDALREYMRERVEGQPFPIKFVLGQRAYLETVSVQGNGFQNT